MTTLQIPVSNEIAIIFQALPSIRRELLSKLISDFIAGKLDVLELMDYISDRAAERGLTEDELAKLLADV
jgi:hypothetical protein